MKSDIQKKQAFLTNLLFYGVILVGFYLISKTFFGLLAPFIIAFVIAAILHKPIQLITKKTPIKRTLPSVIGVFLVFGIVVVILWLIIAAIVGKLKDFSEIITKEFQNLSSYVIQLRDFLAGLAGKLPATFARSAQAGIINFFNKILKNDFSDFSLSSFSVDWSKILSSGGLAIKTTVGQIPSVIVGIVITVIASVFFTIDYDRVIGFIMRQLSEEHAQKLVQASNVTRTTLAKMFKAYSIIMLITTGEMLLGLYALKALHIFDSQYIPIIAVLTAIVDIIPVLGTGTVLIPWAVISLLYGKYAMAIGLIVMYVIIFIIRQVIEPKLVAGQVGLPPIVTIVAMYIGTKTLGILGFFILPFIVILIKEFNTCGILHWFKFDTESSGTTELVPATATETETEVQTDDAKE